MKLYDNAISDIKIAYIGGGSKEWAWKLMADLALESQLSGTLNLYDIDSEAAHENAIVGAMYSQHPDSCGYWEYKVSENLKQALTGADVVILSILPGTFEEMRSDVHAPEKYGIFQAVGDTVGPGGIVRALRTIPLYKDFALNIKKYCPDAWVINYTNPMTVCTRALYKVFPQIKAFGCCHEVFDSQLLFTYVLKELKGIDNVHREEIKTNILGINHFTWIDQAYYKNIDLFPLFQEFADRYYFEGYNIFQNDPEDLKPFRTRARVRFDLFKRYGLIGAAGDRHMVEFLPPWYLKGPDLAKEWMFTLMGVDFRIQVMKNRLETRKRILSGKELISLQPSGEEGVQQIKSLLGLGDMVTNVNFPNKGQMPDFPENAIVETNVHISGMGIKPVIAGHLPSEINSLVIRHIWNQETVVRAALTKDKSLAFKAFISDPLVTISLGDAEKLFDEMLRNTKKYLPGWNV